MALTAAEILVAAGRAVYVGAVGSTAPTTATAAPAAAFTDIGYVTDEGIALETGGSMEEVGAWQSADPVRTILTAREFTIGMGLLQWNEKTLEVAFGGGAVTGSAPYTYTFPSDTAVMPEYALIVDWIDGTNREGRLYVPRVQLAENTTTTLARTAAAALAISFRKLASAAPQLFTPDTAFGP